MWFIFTAIINILLQESILVIYKTIQHLIIYHTDLNGWNERKGLHNI